MKAAEACAAWVRILRSVAAWEISPHEALGRVPEVDLDSQVPSAYWSARDLLEQEVEFESEEPTGIAYFSGVMTKLADRIEAHSLLRP